MTSPSAVRSDDRPETVVEEETQTQGRHLCDCEGLSLRQNCRTAAARFDFHDILQEYYQTTPKCAF